MPNTTPPFVLAAGNSQQLATLREAYLTANAELKAAQERAEAAKTMLRHKMWEYATELADTADLPVIELRAAAGPTLRMRWGTRKSIDQSLLKNQFPAAYAACQTTSAGFWTLTEVK